MDLQELTDFLNQMDLNADGYISAVEFARPAGLCTRIMYVCMYVCMYIYIYIVYIHTRIHIHMYMYKYMYSISLSLYL